MTRRGPASTLAILSILFTQACTSTTTSPAATATAEETLESTSAEPASSPTATEPTAGTLGPGPEVTVVWVGQENSTQPNQVFVEGPWVTEIIPERSGGRVVIDYSTRLDLNLNAADAIRLVREGQADIATGPVASFAQDVPFLEIVDMAGLNPTLEQAKELSIAARDATNAELEPLGVMQVMSNGNAAQVFYCRVPIDGWEDLEGLRIRTFGASLPLVVQAAGATSVDVASAEVYSALERGVVDCAITGAQNGSGLRLYEVTDYLYMLPVAWATAAYFVNLDWWNGLDDDVQAFLEAAFAEMEEEFWDLAERQTRDGRDCNLGLDTCELGTPAEGDTIMTEVLPTDDDLERLRTILRENVLPEWVGRCGEECADRYNEVVAPISGIEYP